MGNVPVVRGLRVSTKIDGLREGGDGGANLGGLVSQERDAVVVEHRGVVRRALHAFLEGTQRAGNIAFGEHSTGGSQGSGGLR